MPDKQTARIGEGKAGPGRGKGTPNKTTALLKDAILKAAEVAGEDGEGKEGLVGYCTFLAKNEPKAFAGLLGRVLPIQVTGDGGGPIVTRVELVALKPELSDKPKPA